MLEHLRLRPLEWYQEQVVEHDQGQPSAETWQPEVQTYPQLLAEVLQADHGRALIALQRTVTHSRQKR